MEQQSAFFVPSPQPHSEPVVLKGWIGVEMLPPAGVPVLVWDGSAISIAKVQRDVFLAEAKGGSVVNRWDIPLTISNVSHWSFLPEPPR